MSTILVTGGAGFIGSHTCKILCEEGHQVVAFDSFSSYVKPPLSQEFVYNTNYRVENQLRGCELLRGSTLDKDDLRRSINKVKPDVIIHFAALPLANLAIEYSEEAFNTIVGGTVNILEVLRDTDIQRFVYISSSMVYGDFTTDPQIEDVTCAPKEIYGGMKLAGEEMVKVYSKRYEFDYSIVRPSAVYGPTDNNDRVLAKFFKNAFCGKPIVARNANSNYLDFSFVEDTAAGIKDVALSDGGKNQTFNITCGHSRTIGEAVQILENFFPDLNVKHEPEEAFRPKRGTLDISKAKELVNYSPSYNLESGMEKYFNYLSGFYKANS